MDNKDSQTNRQKIVISVVNLERYMISSVMGCTLNIVLRLAYNIYGNIQTEHRIWVEDDTEGSLSGDKDME